MNKVKFGLSNVHVLFIEKYDAETKAYTYEKGEDGKDKIRAISGAVDLSLDPQGDNTEFYADDGLFFAQAANTGYSGDLEIARIPDWFRQEALGEIIDDNGVQIEKSDAIIKPFVLFYEIAGDVSKTRFVNYHCTVARPSQKGHTTENTITPATDSMTITAQPRLNDKCTKGFVNSDDEAHADVYKKWYEEMHEPSITA